MTPTREDVDLLRCESSVTIILGPPGFEPPPKNPSGPCPACGNGPTHGLAYCCVCDAVSPALDAKILRATIGMKARERHQAAEERGEAALRKQTRDGRVELSEVDRRLLWNGWKGGIAAPLNEDELTNRAKAGREFLTRIGQPPDFSIVLGHKGRVLGRMGPDDEGADDGGE